MEVMSKPICKQTHDIALPIRSRCYIAKIINEQRSLAVNAPHSLHDRPISDSENQRVQPTRMQPSVRVYRLRRRLGVVGVAEHVERRTDPDFALTVKTQNCTRLDIHDLNDELKTISRQRHGCSIKPSISPTKYQRK